MLAKYKRYGKFENDALPLLHAKGMSLQGMDVQGMDLQGVDLQFIDL